MLNGYPSQIFRRKNKSWKLKGLLNLAMYLAIKNCFPRQATL